METRKKVNQKPKSTLTFTIIVTSILKTLWAIGTSVAATGVLNLNGDHFGDVNEMV